MASEHHGETSPLLPPTAENGHATPASSVPLDAKLSTTRRIAIAAPYLVVFLAFEIALTLVATPMSPIQEAIICRQHFPGASGDDPRCKSEVIQAEFSMLKGWEMTFGLLPGMATAVLYGMAADKYGRRVVLSLSLLGLTLSQVLVVVVCRFPNVFSIRLIWVGGLFTLIGGGPFVTTAMLFVIATDISTEAQRSTTFFYLSAISLVGQLIASPLTFAAMSGSNWLAVFIGLGLLTGSLLALLGTTETYNLRPVGHTCEDAPRTDASPAQSSSAPKMGRTIKQVALSIKSLFWVDKRAGLLLLTFLFTSIGKSIPQILMQYITKRFDWTWAEAGLLNSIMAAVNLVTVGLLLPFASQLLLVQLGMEPPRKDLWLARAGIIALVFGIFGIGLAGTSAVLVMGLVVFSLGYGFGPAVRGLLVHLVGHQRTGTLFTTMSLLESVGLLVSGPLLAGTFKVGMSWGGVWIGLPFMTVGCSMVCAAIIVIGIKVGGPCQLEGE